MKTMVFWNKVSATPTRVIAAWMAVFLCVGLLIGCASRKPARLTDRQIYDAIKLGMSRAEVVRLAGPTYLTAGDQVYYYGSAPAIENWQRQLTPATVTVVFSTNDVVVEKVFNDGKKILDEGVYNHIYDRISK